MATRKTQVKSNATDVMVDLETLGTVADSVILSIGAVRFNPNTDEVDDKAFYASVSIESNLDAGRKISEDTLIWWLGQSADAQRVFHEAKSTLEEALVTFSDWFKDDLPVWACGADFDIPMLAHAFASFKMETPWKFWNARCYRTLKSMPIAKRVAKPTRVGAHNALADARFQAQHLQAIYKEMRT